MVRGRGPFGRGFYHGDPVSDRIVDSSARAPHPFRDACGIVFIGVPEPGPIRPSVQSPVVRSRRSKAGVQARGPTRLPQRSPSADGSSKVSAGTISGARSRANRLSSRGMRAESGKARERHDVHLSRTRRAQGLGAFVDGGSGGVHVVDEEQTPPRNGLRATDQKRAPDIGLTVSAVQGDLRRSPARPAQRVRPQRSLETARHVRADP